jgi:5'-phosphate synthase pdxT subunit
MTAPTRAPHIGVLAMQGDFAEHVTLLGRVGVDAHEVRTLAELDACDGLIIPGGESTTIARLLIAFDLMEPLRARIAAGLPVWGTCAGAILLARDAPALDRPPIGVMDISVDRNAFGRQLESFEADLDVTGIDGAPLRAVFIRAPVISSTGPGVEVLARLDDGRVVACRERSMLATSFHPELTGDTRFHEFFVSLVREALVGDGVGNPAGSTAGDRQEATA